MKCLSSCVVLCGSCDPCSSCCAVFCCVALHSIVVPCVWWCVWTSISLNEIEFRLYGIKQHAIWQCIFDILFNAPNTFLGDVNFHNLCLNNCYKHVQIIMNHAWLNRAQQIIEYMVPCIAFHMCQMLDVDHIMCDCLYSMFVACFWLYVFNIFEWSWIPGLWTFLSTDQLITIIIIE